MSDETWVAARDVGNYSVPCPFCDAPIDEECVGARTLHYSRLRLAVATACRAVADSEAASLRGQVETLQAAWDDEDLSEWPEITVPTPGQIIHRFRTDPAFRSKFVDAAIFNQTEAQRCWMGSHLQRIEELNAAFFRLTAERDRARDIAAHLEAELAKREDRTAGFGSMGRPELINYLVMAEYERDSLASALAEIRRLHERRTDGPLTTYCAEDGDMWPCETERAIRAALPEETE